MRESPLVVVLNNRCYFILVDYSTFTFVSLAFEVSYAYQILVVFLLMTCVGNVRYVFLTISTSFFEDTNFENKKNLFISSFVYSILISWSYKIALPLIIS